MAEVLGANVDWQLVFLLERGLFGP